MPTVRYTVAQGEVIAEKRGGTRSLYVPDPLGSTVALIDNTQTITDTWVYWPYGEVKTRTGTTATPFQYVGTQGYYHDSDGRAYVRARYLDKAKARWLTEDPWSRMMRESNRYAYCMVNPLRWTDPLGLFPCGLCDLLGSPRLISLCHQTCKGPIGKVYGNWCGPGWPENGERPDYISPLDACCRTHDDCYAKSCSPSGAANMMCQILRDIGVPGYLLPPICQMVDECDRVLCNCASNAICNPMDFDCRISRFLIATWFCLGASDPSHGIRPSPPAPPSYNPEPRPPVNPIVPPGFDPGRGVVPVPGKRSIIYE